jgi:hypothetical protein
MAKKDETLDAEIKALTVAADEHGMLAQALCDRLDRTSRGELENPVADARNLLFISRAFADLASKLLYVNELQEQKRQLDALRGDR